MVVSSEIWPWVGRNECRGVRASSGLSASTSTVTGLPGILLPLEGALQVLQGLGVRPGGLDGGGALHGRGRGADAYLHQPLAQAAGQGPGGAEAGGGGGQR